MVAIPKSVLCGLACLVLLVGQASAASPALRVVAAENFYGDIARQIGGDDVSVTSILANPDQDPHLFEISPSVARQVSAAQVVIYNGLDYDPWMGRLLAATRGQGRQVLVAGDLAGKKSGDNPHIWFDPATMLVLAQAVSTTFATLDPAHGSSYGQRLAAFRASILPIQARMAALRLRLQGEPVTATEPIFGATFSALGLVSRNQRFQRAVMNDTEPSASDIAAFESDLRFHRTRLLVFNRQANDTTADRLRAIAGEAGVPVIGASETEPAGTPYQAWILSELDSLDKAMAASPAGNPSDTQPGSRE
jgi:zinc/manganese transport system substrate-binding protein